jgi:hypothetical protein
LSITHRLTDRKRFVILDRLILPLELYAEPDRLENR